ncbi:MAG: hypothetical protein KGK34_01530 [Chloroflexota bacterium]|nr:hypothetical protein [Chloroflexota bacterium]
MREFVGELRAAVRDVQGGKLEPHAIDALLHEWRESAIRPKAYLATLKRTARIRRR